MDYFEQQKFEDIRKKAYSLKIDLGLIKESFIKGSGKGGQKINKTSNAVFLSYEPLKLNVKCQDFRERSLNRLYAFRRLLKKVEFLLLSQNSTFAKRIEKIRKQKAKKKSRYKKKNLNNIIVSN